LNEFRQDRLGGEEIDKGQKADESDDCEPRCRAALAGAAHITPVGAVGPGFITSVPTLSAGQSAADALAEPSGSATPISITNFSDRGNIAPMSNASLTKKFDGPYYSVAKIDRLKTKRNCRLAQNSIAAGNGPPS
jgi:hypothetical protein